jgi:hypothetical protein
MRAPDLLAIAATLACVGCRSHGAPRDAGIGAAASTGDSSDPHPADVPMRVRVLENRVAYIPPQCFTKTRADDDAGHTPARNPCYVCHTRSRPPNFTDDQDLQVILSLPVSARNNPWTNLFDPPALRPARSGDARDMRNVGNVNERSDEEVLRYVREDNYFDDQGNIRLARALDAPPAAWDGDGNGVWDGYRPDVWFRFDDRGFDHRPDGAFSGWRAFAYYPFPGTFFPTNGSADDVLIRLDPSLQENAAGTFDAHVYEVNLAIVEGLITRADVPIEATDEAALGVDLDLDGHLGRATRVAFDGSPDGTATRMRYVGRARDAGPGGAMPIAPGLFPLGTEFFHSVRYLDVGKDGQVTMAPRMKEVRYTKKVEWLTYKQLRARAVTETLEQEQSTDGVREMLWARERGMFNGFGWMLQGFIEAADGALRPQWFEETVPCVGCHGGLGVTTDSIFSFARKIRAGRDATRGWFHWSQHDLRGIAEPRRSDGQYEYALYLREAGAGDELRENGEVLQRFFDPAHALRAAALERLHGDIAYLLLPSPERALDLDRAYRAIVAEQSFRLGRDAVLAPAHNVYALAPIGEGTGIARPVAALALTR